MLAADLVISELMANNTKTLKDKDGAFSDWIEINNRGDAPADLTGWSLTDNPTNLTQWTFPSQSLPAGGFLVVFASGKDIAIAGAELHTNFKLSATGEYLGLVQPDGTTVQFAYAPTFPALGADVAYGLWIDPNGGTERADFLAKPSPGAANGPGVPTSSATPTFSLPNQTFASTSPLQLTLTTSALQGQIRYTIDRSVPSATSLLYTGPITLSISTIVRARVFEPGMAPGPVDSRIYEALDVSVQNFSSNLPVVVLDTFGKGLNDVTLTGVSSFFIDTSAVDGLAHITDTPDFSGRGGLRIRGQSSEGFPKTQMAFETWDESNNDKAVSILGDPKESDWVLYAPYSEKSMMQNYMSYTWGNRLGMYASRTQFVEVFRKTTAGGTLNYATDYIGIYILEEKIKIDNNRVDIQKLAPTDNTDPNITGGYIFKKDKTDGGDPGFTTSIGQNFLYVEPKQNEITSAQKAYLTNYINAFEKALNGANFADPVNGYAKYIDVDSFINNWIMVEMTKNIDGFRLSTYFYKDRGGKIHMGPIWDYNLSMGNADYLNGNIPTGWYHDQLGSGDYPYWTRLFQDPNFKQRLVDRWQELRQDALSTSHIVGDIEAATALLSAGTGNFPVGSNPLQIPDNPIVRNYAKWKDLGVYVWPNGFVGTSWIADVNFMTNFMRTRTAWIDSQFTTPPKFSQGSGPLTSPVQLTMSANGKPIYYTTDGSDPRLPGGKISPQALLYTAPITVDHNTRVRARALVGTDWSSMTDAIFAADTGLRIAEVMYHPQPPPANSPYIADDFQYIELLNSGSSPLNLAGFQFTNGIDFAFPNMTLAAGARTVVVKNLAAFQSRYGTNIPIVGAFVGTKVLAHSGEKITLAGPVGQEVASFKFSDGWYPITDGDGYSLVVNDPANSGSGNLGDSSAWRPSDQVGGAPGTADPGVIPGTVVISEAMSNGSSGDWIELQNTSGAAQDISGWYLSSIKTNLKQYQIQPGTIIPAHGFLVLAAADTYGTAGNPGVSTPFDLSAAGADIYLSNSDGSGNVAGYREHVDFAGADPNVSLGLYTKSTGGTDFVALQTPTPGAANSAPVVGPVVISEISYHPQTGAEFIEIKNITAADVLLYDPANPANTWQLRKAVDFSFPVGSVLPAGAYAMVVPIDPAAFRAMYNVPAGIAIYGPWTGKLDNAGKDPVVLGKPGTPQGVTTPFIFVDKVAYNDKSPWPTLADGGGPSLHRINPSVYGNDPANWSAGLVTPGAAELSEIAPTFDLGADATATEGTAFVRTGSFVDPDPGQRWSATVNWGDAQGQNLLAAKADKSFNLNHTYLAAGTYTLAVTLSDDVGGSVVDTMSVVVVPGVQQGTASADAYTIRLDPTGTNVQVWENIAVDQPPSFFVAMSVLPSLSFNALAGDDTLTIDMSNGNPIPAGGVTFTGGVSTKGDLIRIVGSTSPLNVTIDSTKVSFGSSVITFSSTEKFQIDGTSGDDVVTVNAPLNNFPIFNGGGGSDMLVLKAGSYNISTDLAATAPNLNLIAAGTAVLGVNVSQHLGLLGASDTAKILVAPNGNLFLHTGGVNIGPSATLDLRDNDLILQSAPTGRNAALAALAGWLASGRNGGTWSGLGIMSSIASADANKLTGLGLLLNDNGRGGAIVSSFDGQAVNANSILVKYTWNGDLDLNGVVDASDYFRLDLGFIKKSRGYANGDMNYSGAIDVDDYFLIDKAFDEQTGIL
jgi:hypothetical protein